MSASQIFGRGVGSRKLKLITDLYPNIIEIYNKEGKDHVFKLINNINGFDDKTTTKIVDNMKEFQEWLGKLLKLKKNVLKDQNSNNLNNNDLQKYNNNIKNYSNITIVFTGFRDKDIEIILEKLNSKITNSISKNTNLLIATNPHEKSSKIEKAKELKIKIISKEDFYNDITK
jgi:NAD-dependent DNA ligase